MRVGTQVVLGEAVQLTDVNPVVFSVRDYVNSHPLSKALVVHTPIRYVCL